MTSKANSSPSQKDDIYRHTANQLCRRQGFLKFDRFFWDQYIFCLKWGKAVHGAALSLLNPSPVFSKWQMQLWPSVRWLVGQGRQTSAHSVTSYVLQWDFCACTYCDFDTETIYCVALCRECCTLFLWDTLYQGYIFCNTIWRLFCSPLNPLLKVL